MNVINITLSAQETATVLRALQEAAERRNESTLSNIRAFAKQYEELEQRIISTQPSFVPDAGQS